ETGRAVCRIEKASQDFNLTILPPVDPEPDEAKATQIRVIAASRKKYGMPRADIEAALQSAQEKSSARRPEDIAGPSDAPPPRRPPQPTATAPPPPSESPPAPKPAEMPKATVPTDMGRGGAQHKAIQHRLKADAEALGFVATIEKEIP